MRSLISINLLGANPKIKVEKTDFAIGNFVTVILDDIEIELDKNDFEFLLEQCLENI